MEPIRRSETLYEQVLDTVRAAIVDGTIPPGTVLSAAEIASRLDVSRSPAREAILQLQNEGLVTVLPRRGAVVLEGGWHDIEDIFGFREPLEGMAAALAAERIDDATLDELVGAFTAHSEAVISGDLDRHLELDERFHMLFIQASGNERIIESLRTVRAQLRVMTRRLSAEPGAMDDRIIGAHRAILDAIRDGDRRTAERVARSHVRGVLAFYREHIPGAAVARHARAGRTPPGSAPAPDAALTP